MNKACIVVLTLKSANLYNMSKIIKRKIIEQHCKCNLQQNIRQEK